jgi:hypothetical protein
VAHGAPTPYYLPNIMPKATTRPVRDSRQWRKAAMNNPLCKRSDDGLMLLLLIVMGALLMAFVGCILAYWPPNEPALSMAKPIVSNYSVSSSH